MRDTHRERGRDSGRGRSRLHAPGARCGTRSWDPRITPWAEGGANPLGHWGCPRIHIIEDNLNPVHMVCLKIIIDSINGFFLLR